MAVSGETKLEHGDMLDRLITIKVDLVSLIKDISDFGYTPRPSQAQESAVLLNVIEHLVAQARSNWSQLTTNKRSL